MHSIIILLICNTAFCSPCFPQAKVFYITSVFSTGIPKKSFSLFSAQFLVFSFQRLSEYDYFFCAPQIPSTNSALTSTHFGYAVPFIVRHTDICNAG